MLGLHDRIVKRATVLADRWRAFDRAEALIGIAQAYLRGDQPDRAPIDVMIACGWDGTPAAYGAMIEHLVAIDGLA